MLTRKFVNDASASAAAIPSAPTLIQNPSCGSTWIILAMERLTSLSSLLIEFS